MYHFRQNSSLVAWLTPNTGFESRCGRYISLMLKYAVTQTAKIRGIMTTKSITDSRRIKKHIKNDQYVKVDM